MLVSANAVNSLLHREQPHRRSLRCSISESRPRLSGAAPPILGPPSKACDDVRTDRPGLALPTALPPASPWWQASAMVCGAFAAGRKSLRQCSARNIRRPHHDVPRGTLPRPVASMFARNIAAGQATMFRAEHCHRRRPNVPRGTCPECSARNMPQMFRAECRAGHSPMFRAEHCRRDHDVPRGTLPLQRPRCSARNITTPAAPMFRAEHRPFANVSPGKSCCPDLLPAGKIPRPLAGGQHLNREEPGWPWTKHDWDEGWKRR